MALNAYFDNVYIPNVQGALTVVQSTKFGLQMEPVEAGIEVFANNDKVLQLDHHDEWIEVDALALGVSTIRIMSADKILKDLVVTVSETIARPATTLNSSFSEAEPK